MDSFATAWHAISKTHLLEGLRDPRKPHGYHAKDLDKRLIMMLQHLSYQDTSQKQEKPTPLGLVMVATDAAEPSCPFEKCLADLIQTTIFFCLRSCNYTNTNSHRRTVQFRFKDIQPHDKEGVIPQDAPAEVFLQSRTVTLFLDT